MAATLEQRAYDHIRRKLITGDFVVEERLSEVGLAREIGISATPVREAISRLTTEGLLHKVPGIGSFVRQYTRQDLEEIFELRLLLECYAAQRAATRITPEQLAQGQRLCDTMLQITRRCRDHGPAGIDDHAAAEIVLADVAFHLLVLKASGNGRAYKIIADYHVMAHVCQRNMDNGGSSQPLRDMIVTWRDHTRILRALRRRDAEGARHWMARHVEAANRQGLADPDAGRANVLVRDQSIVDLVDRLSDQ